MNKSIAIELIDVEHNSAVRKFGSFCSAHEGLAIIEEEFEELKAEVFKRPAYRKGESLEKEAIQLGAMALRFLIDIC